MSSDATLAQLLVERELHQLALRYARAADTRSYATFRELFTEQGSIHIHHGNPSATQPEYSLEGRETIVKRMTGLEEFLRTQHLVANQLVEIEGDRAEGETYCTAHHVYREDGALWNLTMAIRYRDVFVREEGRWYFEERRLGVDWERRAPLGEGGWVASS